MGHYTELIFGAKLKEDTPSNVIDSLRALCDIPGYNIYDDVARVYLLDSNTKIERNPLRGGSFYFAITESNCSMSKNHIDNQWQISTRANIKNYQDSIEKFLDWIKPHIEQGSGARDFYAIVTKEDGEPIFYYLKDKD